MSYNWDVGAGGRSGGSQAAAPVLPQTVQTGGTAGGRSGGGQGSAVPALSQPAGLDTPMRITSWDATVGDQGISSLALTLSVPPPSKPSVPSSLYFMQAIATLQAQVAGLATGGGGGSSGGATVTVAAFNSRNLSADFICPGFEDQVTINEAMAALPLNTGPAPVYEAGKMLLYEGNYFTTAPIVLYNETIFEGMGYGTEIVGVGYSGGSSASDYDLIQLTGGPGNIYPFNGAIRNMYLWSFADGNRAGKPIGIIHAVQAWLSNISDIIIENCFIRGNDGIHTGVSTGVYVDTNANRATTYQVKIVDNIFDGTGLDGINISNATDLIIEDNWFDSCGNAIQLNNCYIVTVSGNDFITCGAPTWTATGTSQPYIFGINTGGMVISGNFVQGGGGSAGWPILLESGYDTTITGNTILSDSVGPAVEITGTSNAIAIVGNDLSGNRHGVHLHSPGGTIGLGQGIYNISIANNVMFGCGQDGVTPGSGVNDYPAILLDGTGGQIGYVSITGNNITNTYAFPAGGGFGGGTGIKLQNNVISCLVADNQILQEFTRETGTADIIINDATCVGNEVHGNATTSDPTQTVDHGSSSIVWGNSQAPSGGGGGGVTSFNTRTGAVTLTAADIESTFGAAGQLFYGTGSGTGGLLTVGTTGQVLTVVSGLPAWQTPPSGGFPPAWITTGSTNPLATAPSAIGIFYFDLTNGAMWVSFGTATGDWIQIGGSNGGIQQDYGGINSVQNGIGISVGTGAGAGDVFISDQLANGSGGTGNGWGYFSTGVDGAQSISAFLGSTDQFEWDWNANGTTVTPDMPDTAGGGNNPARAPATTTFTSGTGKQVDTTHDRNVIVQTTTAGSVAIAISPDNVTYYTLGTKALAATDIIPSIYVPAGWYLKLTVTGATLGTATYY